MRGPLPAGVVAGASEHEVSDLHHLELSLFEAACFVWAVEASNDRVYHLESPSDPLASSARESVSAGIPWTTIVLRRPVAPLVMVTASRGTPNRSATNRTNSALAAPSTGDAARVILIASPYRPDTAVRRARGTTCTTT